MKTINNSNELKMEIENLEVTAEFMVMGDKITIEYSEDTAEFIIEVVTPAGDEIMEWCDSEEELFYYIDETYFNPVLF